MLDLQYTTMKYHDETGSGQFKDDADVPELQRRIQALFARAAKTALLKPKRATKFTETGYVGRDADEVMGELLQAADGDVELAQVGIVYVDEIDKEHKRNMKGFGFAKQDEDDKEPEDVQSMLHKEELVKAGAALSRAVPVVAFPATAQLVDDFRRYGIEWPERMAGCWEFGTFPSCAAILGEKTICRLRFSEQALRAVAQKAAKEGTGARALAGHLVSWSLSSKGEE
eukprot:Skav222275  [mRNA]  locus=scaffold807:48963:56428:+ [translate_table: standard]